MCVVKVASCVSCQCIKQLNQAKNAFYLITKKKTIRGATQLDSKYILLDETRDGNRKELNTIFGKMIFIAYYLCDWKRRKLSEIIHNEQEHTISLSLSLALILSKSIYSLLWIAFDVKRRSALLQFILSYLPLNWMK